jgi:hypothetical protein
MLMLGRIIYPPLLGCCPRPTASSIDRVKSYIESFGQDKRQCKAGVRCSCCSLRWTHVRRPRRSPDGCDDATGSHQDQEGSQGVAGFRRFKTGHRGTVARQRQVKWLQAADSPLWCLSSLSKPRSHSGNRSCWHGLNLAPEQGAGSEGKR